MIVKDLIIQLLKMPQHKEANILVKDQGVFLVETVVLDDANNAVVIFLEE